MNSPSDPRDPARPGASGRLSQRQREEQQSTRRVDQSQAARAAALEFKSAEDLIRHDAAEVPLPPGIAERLRDSIAREPSPPPARSWWQRLFGGA